MRLSVTTLALAPLGIALAKQVPLSGHVLDDNVLHGTSESRYFEFEDDIKTVAVIGAGIAGLLSAAALVESGLEVRLFERRPNPGGNWYYQDAKPVPHVYPSVSSKQYPPN